MDLDEIVSNLVVGSCPESPGDVERLRNEHGITAVLNVQTNEDLAIWGVDLDGLKQAYEAAGIVLRHEPVRDFDSEALRRRLPECVDVLAELIKDNHKVLVHCSAGINRSPTTVVAYLHRRQGWDLDEAVRHIVGLRDCEPLVEAIRTADWDAVGK